MLKLLEQPQPLSATTSIEDDLNADRIVGRRLRWLLLIGLIFEFSLIIYTRSLQKKYNSNFFTEGTFFTWFSGAQLAAIALVSFANAYLAYKAFLKKYARAWVGAGLLAIFLSLSELFTIHERVAPFSGRIFRAVGLASLKSSFWDIPVFTLYGLAAIAVWHYLKSDILRSRVSKYLLITGFVITVTGLALDILGSGLVLVVWEDSFKLIGFFFFLAAFTGSLIFKKELSAE